MQRINMITPKSAEKMAENKLQTGYPYLMKVWRERKNSETGLVELVAIEEVDIRLILATTRID